MKGSCPSLAHIFLTSVSILSYEILLTRIFAISQWNHLVFLVISIALFGLAASGTLYNVLNTSKGNWRNRIHHHSWPSVLCSLQVLVSIGAYIGFNALPLDYYRLVLEPLQLIFLLTSYLMLAAPFLVAGLVISSAYSAQPQRSGPIYFATMTGSACGAILPAALIPMLAEPLSIVITSLLPLCAQPFYAVLIERQSRGRPDERRPAIVALVLGLAAVLAAAYLMTPPGIDHLRLRSSEYKGLNQALRFPDTHVVSTHHSLLGNIDRVQGPYLRFAPGLSLNFKGRLPAQQVVFYDRDIPMTLYPAAPADLTFARATLSYAAYTLITEPRSVLISPENGGLSLACALSAGAANIQVIVRHPQLARIVGANYGLPVASDHPRAFVARSAGGFDIIQIENWGSTIPGADALSQNHGLTVDAFEAYLNILNPDGALTLSRRLLLPPSDILRIWATAYDALVRIGSSNPFKHVAILRNWDSYTLIVTRQPLKDRRQLIEWADQNAFDIVYLDSMTAQMANRFNQLPQPYYYQRLAQLADARQSGQADRFIRRYPLDIKPQTDSRPFPGRFLKWFRINTLFKSIGARIHGLFLSGEVVVMVTMIEALVMTILLLLIPRRMMRPEPLPAATGPALYFLCIGCGFMFFEIYAIHLYTFVFGDPVVGFSVVLTGLLIFSGLGGLMAQIWTMRAVRIILMILLALLTALAIGEPRWGLEWMLVLSPLVRLILALMILLPFGLLIGMPFPLGMRFMVSSPGARAYAWSVNGCASVISAVLATQFAISFGLGAILIGALTAYALSLIIIFGYLRAKPAVDNMASHGNKIGR